jgi:hydrogenase expression/formation protein HypC
VCLGIPGRVTRIVDEARGIAEVDQAGRSRQVSLLLLKGPEQPGVGDFVLVHAGMAVSRVDEQEAGEILRMLEGFGEPMAEPEPVVAR